MNQSFEAPTQVSFRLNDYWDMNGHKCLFGIAYHDHVICGCCGHAFEVKDCVQITPYTKWIDIAEAIGGDDYHDSLEE